jgi:hypothetical protein
MTVTGPKAKPFLGAAPPLGVSAARPGAFSSQVETLGDSENATKQELGAFSSQVETLGDSENATKQELGAFSGQVETLGDSENATKQEFRAPTVNEGGRKPL